MEGGWCFLDFAHEVKIVVNRRRVEGLDESSSSFEAILSWCAVNARMGLGSGFGAHEEPGVEICWACFAVPTTPLESGMIVGAAASRVATHSMRTLSIWSIAPATNLYHRLRCLTHVRLVNPSGTTVFPTSEMGSWRSPPGPAPLPCL